MTIVTEPNTGGDGLWAFVREGDRIELSAQGIPADQPNEFVVVWRARVRPERLRWIVRQAHDVFVKLGGPIRGRLTGYGPTKEFLNLGRYMSAESDLPACEAYRAELENMDGTVLIWANVVEGDDRDLAHAADNIGMRVPASSLGGWGGELIAQAIASTKDVELSSVQRWMEDLSDELLHPPGRGGASVAG